MISRVWLNEGAGQEGPEAGRWVRRLWPVRGQDSRRGALPSPQMTAGSKGEEGGESILHGSETYSFLMS